MMSQPNSVAATLFSEASMEGRVIRCGCGDPLNIHERNEAGELLPCPTPRDTDEVLTGVSVNEGA